VFLRPIQHSVTQLFMRWSLVAQAECPMGFDDSRSWCAAQNQGSGPGILGDGKWCR
jgi:hypothetical protein